MTTFIVDGQPYQLQLIDQKTGTDMSADFIGNSNHGMQTDKDGNYIATQEDLEWWQSTIAATETMHEMVRQYAEKYGDEAVEQAISHCFGYDMDDQPDRVMEALKDLDN